MKRIKLIGYFVVLSILTIRPYLVDMVSLKLGWDREIPVGIPGGWTGYLIFAAIVMFMMIAVSWYHCLFQNIEIQENEKEKPKKYRREKYVWLLTMLVGTILVLLNIFYLELM